MASVDVDAVFSPKAAAASHVHHAAMRAPLEALALFSSVAATLGNVGQANYASANACLDELLRVCSRRSQLVCRYLPNYAAEFRRDEFEHDRRALLEGRLSAVRARRLGSAGDESPERRAVTDKARALSM